MPSAAVTAAMLAQRSGAAIITCLTIRSQEEPDFILRICNAKENLPRTVDEEAVEFVAYPFQLRLPVDNDETLPRARLRLCNVDLGIITQLRALPGSLSCTIELVEQSTPDTVEGETMNFTIGEWEADQDWIDIDLAPEDVLNEPFPAVLMTPNNAPGAF